jgi:5,5'-dehydrodivanillate O-demethylase
MLTPAENEALTRVGRGTPAGEMLRRYWYVVGTTHEMNAETPVRRVRVLGEDLVLFRTPPATEDGLPGYGLVQERCPHRLASFVHGIVDCEGIRCIYHGWKFAADGSCLEMPAENSDSTFKDRIHVGSYPVQKLAGLLFAYLGPAAAPLLPRWDVLVREDGRRWGIIESVIDCNWLQPMENSVDPSHLYWLHGSVGSDALPTGEERFAVLGVPAEYEEKHEYIPFKYGIQKVRITPGKTPDAPPLAEQHPLVFPTGLRLVLAQESIRKQGYAAAGTITPEEATLGYVHNMQFRTPIDDTHTMHYNMCFLPSETHMTAAEDPPFEVCPFKKPGGEYNLEYVTAQDVLAWEAQGELTDRSQEHLAGADRGITLLRKVIREQIDAVRRGEDPLGVIRDGGENASIDLDVYHEPFGLYRALEHAR